MLIVRPREALAIIVRLQVQATLKNKNIDLTSYS
jgi:hypothetical protein